MDVTTPGTCTLWVHAIAPLDSVTIEWAGIWQASKDGEQPGGRWARGDGAGYQFYQFVWERDKISLRQLSGYNSIRCDCVSTIETI